MIIELTAIAGLAALAAGAYALKTPAYFKIADMNSRGVAAPKELHANAQKMLDNLNIIQAELFKLNPAYKIVLHSTYRTPAHNSAVRGASNSLHMQARAVDFSVQNLPASQVQKIVFQLMRAGKIYAGGIGQGANYTHYDTGGKARTWKYGTNNQSYSVSLNTLL